MAYIYKITNDINNKVYIGKTEFSIEKRFKEHCQDAFRDRNEKRPLYSAMRKYGIEHFHIELIEETDNPEEREIYWIEALKTFKLGYNATKGGDGRKYIDYDLIISTYKEVGNMRKTAEILNTDAEGRLILADALYMATKTDPEIIIDAATLTGACTVALGPFCAGLFSNRKFLSKQITDISWEVAEDVWELPIFDGYEQGINSTVADIQNMSTFGREGGAIHAAIFLKQFVDNYPWIHLDIAGPAFLKKNHPIFGKEATGFGLRLLYQFIETHYLEADNAGY